MKYQRKMELTLILFSLELLKVYMYFKVELEKAVKQPKNEAEFDKKEETAIEEKKM